MAQPLGSRRGRWKREAAAALLRSRRRPPLRRDGGRLGRIRGPASTPYLMRRAARAAGIDRARAPAGSPDGHANGASYAAAAPPARGRRRRRRRVVVVVLLERRTRHDEFDDPDLEAKFRRMLETPEGREAVDAERARAERLVDRRERERYEAWRRRRRRRQTGGGGFLWTLVTLPLKVPLGVIRWGWNRWRRRPEAAGDGSDVAGRII